MGNGVSTYDHFELRPSSRMDYGRKSRHHCIRNKENNGADYLSLGLTLEDLFCFHYSFLSESQSTVLLISCLQSLFGLKIELDKQNLKKFQCFHFQY